MSQISQKRIHGYLKVGDDASTTTERGRALEDLVCYVFGKVPGLRNPTRNKFDVFGAEEIDVLFWNDKHKDGLPFLETNVVLIECKNWSVPLGSPEVIGFDAKLRGVGVDFGILVAAKGITGDAPSLANAHLTLATALHEKRQILVFTRDDLLTLETTRDLVEQIKKKIMALIVRKSPLVPIE